MRPPRLSLIVACSVAVIVTMTVAPPASAAVMSSKVPECTITGTDRDDVLIGTSGSDVICGGWGRDVIRGLGGNDIILAGAGDDRVYGGEGDDKLIGGSGDDVLRGGSGADFLAGSEGDDLMVGGSGDDNLERRDPLRNDQGTWNVDVAVTYAGIDEGSKVTWLYQLPSGNCMNHWQGWTDTVNNSFKTAPFVHLIFTTVDHTPWESCSYERSYGTWTVTVVAPSGKTKVGSVKVSTGSPNIFSHYAETICGSFPHGFDCTGGSQTLYADSDKAPTPPVTIGPDWYGDSAPAQ